MSINSNAPHPRDTNITISDDSTCPECGGGLRTADYRELYCSDCGLIVEEDLVDRRPEWRTFNDSTSDQRSRVGPPRTAHIHDGGLSTTISTRNRDGYGNTISEQQRQFIDRLAKLNNQQTSAERTQSDGLEEIRRIVAGLGRDDTMTNTACQLFKTAHNEDLFKGRSAIAIAAASVYAAGRMHPPAIQVDTVQAETDISTSKLRNSISLLNRELDLPLKITTPQQRIARIVDQLEVPAAVEFTARDLLNEAGDQTLGDGRSPSGAAAAAVYVAAQSHDVNVTQDAVADAAGVCATTIRDQADDFQ